MGTIALDNEEKAEGEIYLDDGNSFNFEKVLLKLIDILFAF